MQQLQHAWPAPVLVRQGLDHIRASGGGLPLLLGSAEILTGALVIAAFVRDLLAVRRSTRESTHVGQAAHGVHWFDIVLAAMLATEAVAHWHETGHLPRPTVLMAAVMLTIGLFHGRMIAGRTRRRSLRLTSQGVTIGGRFFTRFTASWSDIDRIDIDATRATIVTRAGRTRGLDFRDLQNAEQVRGALETARGHAITARAAAE